MIAAYLGDEERLEEVAPELVAAVEMAVEPTAVE